MKPIWEHCACCNCLIEGKWQACPKCDGQMGFEIWKRFCNKNKLYVYGVVAGLPKKVLLREQNFHTIYLKLKHLKGFFSKNALAMIESKKELLKK
jgi:hypothetical protein